MPPKSVKNTSSSSRDRGDKATRQQAQPQSLHSPQIQPPSTMATQTQTSRHPVALNAPRSDMARQLRLPPILPSPTAMAASQFMPSSALTSPYGPEGAVPFSPGRYTPTRRPNTYSEFPFHDRSQPAYTAPVLPAGSNPAIRNAQPMPLIPQKRPFRTPDSSYGPPPPLSLLTPASIPSRSLYSQNMPQPLSAHSSVSNASTPTGTTASFPLPGHVSTVSRPSSDISSNTITTRCSLHIRQQPRAARAGPDGKDRRNIDPPPVLQLLLNDFDPDSPTDISELKSNHYVVHCKLISAESPRRDVTTHITISEDGSRETSRLLLGTNVASPFFCADDPDVSTMPRHPRSTELERPPSPSSRFIQSSTAPPPPNTPASTLPGAFFIFADLSVRRAGSYRLEFTLMKIDPSAMNLPMIHICTSQVFKVVNAKDFDQVHPSTTLVRGLLSRGAPFPLKLKKGIREGQRRRNVGDEGESVEGSNEGDRAGREDDEEEEGDEGRD